jgi:hypothetical protein
VRTAVPLLLVISLVAAAGPARADAVMSPQPSRMLLPNHDRYTHGSKAQPYLVTFDPGTDPRAVDDVHVFEPVAGKGALRAAPVVVLLHGYPMDGPETVEELIAHLTRRGMTVIYPAYVDVRPGGNDANFPDWVARAHDAIGRGLGLLATPGHVAPLRDRDGEPVVAYVAYSIGSYVAAFVAERATDEGGPAPRTIVMADPAGHDYAPYIGIAMDQPWDLDPRTELVILSAEGTLVETNARGAVEDFLAYLPIDCSRRSAWIVPHDSEQGTALVSDHRGFLARHPTDPSARFDAIDWWGYWLHVSAHLEHTFFGRYGAYRHGGGAFNGIWLDAATGVPLRFGAWKRPHPSYPQGHGCAAPR